MLRRPPKRRLERREFGSRAGVTKRYGGTRGGRLGVTQDRRGRAYEEGSDLSGREVGTDDFGCPFVFRRVIEGWTKGKKVENCASYRPGRDKTTGQTHATAEICRVKLLTGSRTDLEGGKIDRTE